MHPRIVKARKYLPVLVLVIATSAASVTIFKKLDAPQPVFISEPSRDSVTITTSTRSAFKIYGCQKFKFLGLCSNNIHAPEEIVIPMPHYYKPDLGVRQADTRVLATYVSEQKPNLVLDASSVLLIPGLTDRTPGQPKFRPVRIQYFVHGQVWIGKNDAGTLISVTRHKEGFFAQLSNRVQVFSERIAGGYRTNYIIKGELALETNSATRGESDEGAGGDLETRCDLDPARSDPNVSQRVVDLRVLWIRSPNAEVVRTGICDEGFPGTAADNISRTESQMLANSCPFNARLRKSLFDHHQIRLTIEIENLSHTYKGIWSKFAFLWDENRYWAHVAKGNNPITLHENEPQNQIAKRLNENHMVVYSTANSGKSCGLAISIPAATDARTAVIRDSCELEYGTTLSHEIAHLLGAHHQFEILRDEDVELYYSKEKKMRRPSAFSSTVDLGNKPRGFIGTTKDSKDYLRLPYAYTKSIRCDGNISRLPPRERFDEGFAIRANSEVIENWLNDNQTLANDSTDDSSDLFDDSFASKRPTPQSTSDIVETTFSPTTPSEVDTVTDEAGSQPYSSQLCASVSLTNPRCAAPNPNSSVGFKYGAWELSPNEARRLSEIVRNKVFGNKIAIVQGYASARGRDANNWRLAHLRASSVAKLIRTNSNSENVAIEICVFSHLLTQCNLQGKDPANQRVVIEVR